MVKVIVIDTQLDFCKSKGPAMDAKIAQIQAQRWRKWMRENPDKIEKPRINLD